MLSHKRVMVAMAALLLCPSPAAARDSFLKRMARQYTDSSSVAGLLPRASHGTVRVRLRQFAPAATAFRGQLAPCGRVPC